MSLPREMVGGVCVPMLTTSVLEHPFTVTITDQLPGPAFRVGATAMLFHK